jgi:hypothetical protein
MLGSDVGVGTSVGVGGTRVRVGASVGVGGTVFVGKGVKVGRAVLDGGIVEVDWLSVVGVGIGPLHAAVTSNAAMRATLQMIFWEKRKAGIGWGLLIQCGSFA